jgi:hypothetical protein
MLYDGLFMTGGERRKGDDLRFRAGKSSLGCILPFIPFRNVRRDSKGYESGL